jgi:hypothetical protein
MWTCAAFPLCIKFGLRGSASGPSSVQVPNDIVDHDDFLPDLAVQSVRQGLDIVDGSDGVRQALCIRGNDNISLQ